jgi:RimJ/RimL family protein N-acetyltransferase
MKTRKLEHTNDLWVLQNQPDWLSYTRIGIPDPSQEVQVFLEQNGFKLLERSIRSHLQLQKLLALSLVQQLEQQGYVFKTLLELGDSKMHHEKLYWLVRGAVEDDPAFEGEFETFEQFNEYIWEIYWNNASGVFIALHNSDWVSISGVHFDQIFNNGVPTTLAGTARAHRGLGLAQALKTLAINEVVKRGLTEIRTSNDSRNAAILAINKKLGFEKIGEFVWFVK